MAVHRSRVVLEDCLALGCRELVHPFWPTSCRTAALQVWIDGFAYAAKLYFPLFFAPLVVRRRFRNVGQLLRDVLPLVARSSAFMATLGAATVPFTCFMRWAFGPLTPFRVFLAGVWTGAVSFPIEHPRRRGDVRLYAFQQAAESLVRMLHVRGYLPTVKNANVLVFSLASALLCFLFYRDRPILGKIGSILEVITNGTRPVGWVPAVSPPIPDEPVRHVPQPSASGDEPVSVPAPPRAYKIPELHGPEVLSERTAILTARALFGAYAAKSALSLLQHGLLRRLYRRPGELLRLSFGRGSVEFAAFAALFVAGWRVLPSLVDYKLGRRRTGTAALLGGAAAGLSSYFFQSSEVSGFLLSKACEAYWNSLVSKGVVRPVRHAGYVLFSLAVGVLFFCSTFEPYNLRPSYFRFLLGASNGRYKQFEPMARSYAPEWFEKTGFKY